MREREVIVGATALDWLTLTTFDELAAGHLRQMTYARSESAGIHERSRMQYKGQGGDGWFFGWGVQKEMPHLLVQYSGALADMMRRDLSASLWKTETHCTRIDIQLTLPKQEDTPKTDAIGLSLRKAFSEVRGLRGVRPSVKVISSEVPNDDTVYIGSRAGQKFIRIYDKNTDEGNYLRFEVEYKRKSAETIWNECTSDASQMRLWLWSALPEHMWNLPGLAAFGEILAGRQEERKCIVTERPDDSRTMDWLEETVGLTVGRLAMGPERDRLKMWLDRLGRVV